MLQLAFAYFPIVLLIYLMTKKDSMPSNKALPLCALLLYFIVLIIFKFEPNRVHAAVLDGLLLAWTPILIIAGAIFLFRTMEVTGALDIIRNWLNTISSNPVAQLMIVGWAFAFLIEGASGFGTPAAIAAPVLVGLGFPVIRVAIFCLILNSVPVTFGAVGTPIWFGFSGVSLLPEQLVKVAFKAALINTIAAPFIVFLALLFIVDSTTTLKKNSVFILLSTFACVFPYLILSFFSTEFPALLGGIIGLIISVLLAKKGIGLEKTGIQTKVTTTNFRSLLKASFPLWGTVMILVITRIPQLGIKPLLQLTEPLWQWSLGSLGDFSVSASLVLSLSNIFQTEEVWQHSLLYVPSLIPFGLVATLTLFMYPQGSVKEVFSDTAIKMKNPVLALLGALVFVNLLMLGGEHSVVTRIGQNLADLSGEQWGFFAAFLGALGSFFSGSATISNLTFGSIQHAIATDLGLNLTSILALQSVGAAMGNMVCINNIVAVCSVLGLISKEGYILKRTVLVMLVYGVVAAVMGVFLL